MIISQAIPLSLYIHIPWCIKKCPYCDFNSHPKKGVLDESAYIDHLIKDFSYDYDGRPIQSIFIGGGTPSLFSGKAIATLLAGISKQSIWADDIEITLEANPGTFEYEKFQDYRQAGVNRLSIGVQSFQNQFLKILGRVHHGEEARQAIICAQQAGFERINTDLMFALPEQNEQQALFDLQQSIDLSVEHISWYQLTIEPNTTFYTKPPKNLPDAHLQNEIYLRGQSLLKNAGYHQYEISAWRKNLPSKHNLNYWQFGDYIGIGAGAHSKLTDRSRIIRSSKFSSPQTYQNAAGKFTNPYMNTRKGVSKEEQPFEFMMNALRLAQGVPQILLSERSECQPKDIQPTVDRLIKQGLLENNQRYQATEKGYLVLNNVLEFFL